MTKVVVDASVAFSASRVEGGFGLLADDNLKRPRLKLDSRDLAEDRFGPEALRLLLELLHQLRAEYPLGKTGVVFHLRGNR